MGTEAMERQIAEQLRQLNGGAGGVTTTAATSAAPSSFLTMPAAAAGDSQGGFLDMPTRHGLTPGEAAHARSIVLPSCAGTGYAVAGEKV